MSCNAASDARLALPDGESCRLFSYIHFLALQSSDASTHGGHLYSDPFRFWRDRERHFVHLGRYTDARDDEGFGNQFRRGCVLGIVCAVRHTKAGMTRTMWRQWTGSTSEVFGVQPRADRGSVSSRVARAEDLRCPGVET